MEDGYNPQLDRIVRHPANTSLEPKGDNIDERTAVGLRNQFFIYFLFPPAEW